MRWVIPSCSATMVKPPVVAPRSAPEAWLPQKSPPTLAGPPPANTTREAVYHGRPPCLHPRAGWERRSGKQRASVQRRSIPVHKRDFLQNLPPARTPDHRSFRLQLRLDVLASSNSGAINHTTGDPTSFARIAAAQPASELLAQRRCPLPTGRRRHHRKSTVGDTTPVAAEPTIGAATAAAAAAADGSSIGSTDHGSEDATAPLPEVGISA